ncbi:MAG: MBL fold metallo-hydrolase, partial [Clostridia bacterium]|nr:MBL fold metallo-hydrolase [Clostridia bacterium]
MMVNPYIPYPFNTPATVEVFPDSEGKWEALLGAFPKDGISYMTRQTNRFAMIWGEEYDLYFCHYPTRGEIRKITCPKPAFTHRPQNDTDRPRITTPALYQIDLDNRRIDCGMSYVYQLADGRFFLIDGGYFTYGESERLYALLRSLRPSGKLPIAGWFFSHAHQDHFGCFIEFILRYQQEIALEALYYTFPSLTLPEACRFKQSDNATMREFDYTVSRVLP